MDNGSTGFQIVMVEAALLNQSLIHSFPFCRMHDDDSFSSLAHDTCKESKLGFN